MANGAEQGDHITVRDNRPADTAEFRQRMRRLRADCDGPTQAEMRQAIATFNVDKLARATLSEFLNDVRSHNLPKWEFVRSYVAACLLHHGTPPTAVSEQLRTWASWWSSLATSPAAAPVPETRLPTKVEEAPVEAPAPPKRTLRTAVIIVVSVLAGFGTGVAATVWWSSSPGPDPSLAYGICAEAIRPSTSVGHVALLADTGPHGKPVQDRLVELRIQEHPDHGWIAWAYLQRTPSDLDRLWLDWSYMADPGSDQSNYRQCGAQPVTEGRGTPGILVTDDEDRDRWFRACGQVPTADRAPDQPGTFCTSWTRPRVS